MPLLHRLLQLGLTGRRVIPGQSQEEVYELEGCNRFADEDGPAGPSAGGWCPRRRRRVAAHRGRADRPWRFRRGARLPLIVAGVAGALAAVQAIATLEKINSDGAITVLGQQYRYLDPAWGLYLVLGAAIALVGFASALAWRAFPRAQRGSTAARRGRA
jgi:hypothetical protein